MLVNLELVRNRFPNSPLFFANRDYSVVSYKVKKKSKSLKNVFNKTIKFDATGMNRTLSLIAAVYKVIIIVNNSDKVKIYKLVN